jgi:hypothetical protein
MLDNVNQYNTHGKKKRKKRGMPATSAELRLPDTKLLANQVLALCRPLHQLMLGQVAPIVSNTGFYSKAQQHLWDPDQLPANATSTFYSVKIQKATQ